MNLMQLRAQFPALMQTVDGKSPVFLDGPGGSQVPQPVLSAMTAYLGHYNSNLGGAFFSNPAVEAILSSFPGSKIIDVRIREDETPTADSDQQDQAGIEDDLDDFFE